MSSVALAELSVHGKTCRVWVTPTITAADLLRTASALFPGLVSLDDELWGEDNDRPFHRDEHIMLPPMLSVPSLRVVSRRELAEVGSPPTTPEVRSVSPGEVAPAGSPAGSVASRHWARPRSVEDWALWVSGGGLVNVDLAMAEGAGEAVLGPSSLEIELPGGGGGRRWEGKGFRAGVMTAARAVVGRLCQCGGAESLARLALRAVRGSSVDSPPWDIPTILLSARDVVAEWFEAGGAKWRLGSAVSSGATLLARWEEAIAVCLPETIGPRDTQPDAVALYSVRCLVAAFLLERRKPGPQSAFRAAWKAGVAPSKAPASPGDLRLASAVVFLLLMRLTHSTPLRGAVPAPTSAFLHQLCDTIEGAMAAAFATMLQSQLCALQHRRRASDPPPPAAMTLPNFLRCLSWLGLIRDSSDPSHAALPLGLSEPAELPPSDEYRLHRPATWWVECAECTLETVVARQLQAPSPRFRLVLSRKSLMDTLAVACSRIASELIPGSHHGSEAATLCALCLLDLFADRVAWASELPATLLPQPQVQSLSDLHDKLKVVAHEGTRILFDNSAFVSSPSIGWHMLLHNSEATARLFVSARSTASILRGESVVFDQAEREPVVPVNLVREEDGVQVLYQSDSTASSSASVDTASSLDDAEGHQSWAVLRGTASPVPEQAPPRPISSRNFMVEAHSFSEAPSPTRVSPSHLDPASITSGGAIRVAPLVDVEHAPSMLVEAAVSAQKICAAVREQAQRVLLLSAELRETHDRCPGASEQEMDRISVEAIDGQDLARYGHHPLGEPLMGVLSGAALASLTSSLASSASSSARSSPIAVPHSIEDLNPASQFSEAVEAAMEDARARAEEVDELTVVVEIGELLQTLVDARKGLAGACESVYSWTNEPVIGSRLRDGGVDWAEALGWGESPLDKPSRGGEPSLWLAPALGSLDSVTIEHKEGSTRSSSGSSLARTIAWNELEHSRLLFLEALLRMEQIEWSALAWTDSETPVDWEAHTRLVDFKLSQVCVGIARVLALMPGWWDPLELLSRTLLLRAMLSYPAIVNARHSRAFAMPAPVAIAALSTARQALRENLQRQGWSSSRPDVPFGVLRVTQAVEASLFARLRVVGNSKWPSISEEEDSPRESTEPVDLSTALARETARVWRRGIPEFGSSDLDTVSMEALRPASVSGTSLQACWLRSSSMGPLRRLTRDLDFQGSGFLEEPALRPLGLGHGRLKRLGPRLWGWMLSRFSSPGRERATLDHRGVLEFFTWMAMFRPVRFSRMLQDLGLVLGGWSANRALLPASFLLFCRETAPNSSGLHIDTGGLDALEGVPDLESEVPMSHLSSASTAGGKSLSTPTALLTSARAVRSTSPSDPHVFSQGTGTTSIASSAKSRVVAVAAASSVKSNPSSHSETRPPRIPTPPVHRVDLPALASETLARGVRQADIDAVLSLVRQQPQGLPRAKSGSMIHPGMIDPSAASSRCFDYCISVALGAVLDPSAVSLSESPESLLFAPRMVYRVPETDMKEAELPPSILAFAFPDSMSLASQWKPDEYLPFVLTQGDGTVFYCSALQWWQPIHPAVALSLFAETDVQSKGSQDDADEDVRSVSSSEVSTDGSTSPESFSSSRHSVEMKIRAPVPSPEQASSDIVIPPWLAALTLPAGGEGRRSLFSPKALVLISRQPLFGLQRFVLGQLRRVQASEAAGLRSSEYPVEAHVAYAMGLPLPPVGQTSIGVTMEDSQAVVGRPHASHLSRLDLPVAPILLGVDPESLISAVIALLCERQIIIVSPGRPELLTPACELLLTLAQPMRWLCPYVPVLPKALSHLLGVPTPCLLGWPGSLREAQTAAPDAFMLDLSTGRAVNPSLAHRPDTALPSLPQSIKRTLVQALALSQPRQVFSKLVSGTLRVSSSPPLEVVAPKRVARVQSKHRDAKVLSSVEEKVHPGPAALSQLRKRPLSWAVDDIPTSEARALRQFQQDQAKAVGHIITASNCANAERMDLAAPPETRDAPFWSVWALAFPETLGIPPPILGSAPRTTGRDHQVALVYPPWAMGDGRGYTTVAASSSGGGRSSAWVWEQRGCVVPRSMYAFDAGTLNWQSPASPLEGSLGGRGWGAIGGRELSRDETAMLHAAAEGLTEAPLNKVSWLAQSFSSSRGLQAACIHGVLHRLAKDKGSDGSDGDSSMPPMRFPPDFVQLESAETAPATGNATDTFSLSALRRQVEWVQDMACGDPVRLDELLLPSPTLFTVRIAFLHSLGGMLHGYQEFLTYRVVVWRRLDGSPWEDTVEPAVPPAAPPAPEARPGLIATFDEAGFFTTRKASEKAVLSRMLATQAWDWFLQQTIPPEFRLPPEAMSRLHLLVVRHQHELPRYTPPDAAQWSQLQPPEIRRFEDVCAAAMMNKRRGLFASRKLPEPKYLSQVIRPIMLHTPLPPLEAVGEPHTRVKRGKRKPVSPPSTPMHRPVQFGESPLTAEYAPDGVAPMMMGSGEWGSAPPFRGSALHMTLSSSRLAHAEEASPSAVQGRERWSSMDGGDSRLDHSSRSGSREARPHDPPQLMKHNASFKESGALDPAGEAIRRWSHVLQPLAPFVMTIRDVASVLIRNTE
jgi:hypothetical protein